MTPDEREFLTATINEALSVDGGHHKQWYLEQVARYFELTVDVDYEPGIPP